MCSATVSVSLVRVQCRRDVDTWVGRLQGETVESERRECVRAAWWWEGGKKIVRTRGHGHPEDVKNRLLSTNSSKITPVHHDRKNTRENKNLTTFGSPAHHSVNHKGEKNGDLRPASAQAITMSTTRRTKKGAYHLRCATMSTTETRDKTR